MSENSDYSGRRTAIYVSTSDRSATTVINQINAARNFAQQVGIEVVAEYIDLRGSQAQLLHMMADATTKDPPFRKILAFDLTRIFGYANETSGCRESLDANGVEIMAVAEPRASETVQTIGKIAYSEHSEHVRRGMRETARRGFYAFGNPPYGYRKVDAWDNGVRRFKLEPDPPASETVRMIFDLRLGGATVLEISAELNAIGATFRVVGPWRERHVSRILSNEVYSGTSVAAREDMQSPDTAVRKPNAFPAIVTQEEFDQVQRMWVTAGIQPGFAAPGRRSGTEAISQIMIGDCRG
ncbi:MAG: recombinase family protein [Chloroflexi bacterium]|nr:recombinase family protein [Chloroflexota bacterium]